MEKQIGVILDTAKNEIENTVLGIMQRENIPFQLMSYVLDSVALSIANARSGEYSNTLYNLDNKEEQNE